MPLIIFNKKQQISFLRFAYSVVAGAFGVWLFGRLHDSLHYGQHHWFVTADVDLRLLLFAVLLAAVFGLVYLWGGSPPLDMPLPKHEHLPSIRQVWVLAKCRNVCRWVFAINIFLILLGLYGLVWLPMTAKFDLSWSLERIALNIFAVFLPFNYAAKLFLEECMGHLPSTSWWFAKQTHGSVLYWILVIFWAALMASYIILLASSRVYCKYWMC